MSYYTPEDMIAIMQKMEQRYLEPKGRIYQFPDIQGFPLDRQNESLTICNYYDLPYHAQQWAPISQLQTEIAKRFSSTQPDLWARLANAKRGQIICGSLTPGSCVTILALNKTYELGCLITGPLHRLIPRICKI